MPRLWSGDQRLLGPAAGCAALLLCSLLKALARVDGGAVGVVVGRLWWCSRPSGTYTGDSSPIPCMENHRASFVCLAVPRASPILVALVRGLSYLDGAHHRGRHAGSARIN